MDQPLHKGHLESDIIKNWGITQNTLFWSSTFNRKQWSSCSMCLEWI